MPGDETDDARGALRGRGAPDQPASRFVEIAFARDGDDVDAAARANAEEPGAAPAPATRFFRDASRSIVASNDSPDVGFGVSVNPYRGCEHGCIYCYARPTHEYFGLSAGLDFETKILVKERAPELLRAALLDPKWQPQLVAMSGVTDCYQPIERKLQLTRRCLEVLAEFRNPVAIVTKNALVARDADVLQELARVDAAMVVVTITTLDAELAAVLEPRASRPAARLAAIAQLAQAGISTSVMLGPVIPGLTDHEIPAIVKAAAEAGAISSSWILVRLPHGVKDLFQAWLDRHRPERKEKILHRIRELRGGRLNDSRFGSRMRGEGEWSRQIEQLYESAVASAGLRARRFELNTKAFRRPGPQQGALFGDPVSA